MKKLLTTTAVLLATMSSAHAITLEEFIDAEVATAAAELLESHNEVLNSAEIAAITATATAEFPAVDLQQNIDAAIAASEAKAIANGYTLTQNETNVIISLATQAWEDANAQEALDLAQNALVETEADLATAVTLNEAYEEALASKDATIATITTNLEGQLDIVWKQANWLTEKDATIAAQAAELDESNAYLAEYSATIVTTKADLAETEAALALKTSDYNVLKNVHNITQAAKLATNQRIWAADAENWHSFGDVYSNKSTNGISVSSASNDIGTVSTGLVYYSGHKYASVNNVTVTSNYGTFSMETDLQIRNNATSINGFYDILEELNDKVYKEGYKDGFNDGYESGYSDGWNDAVAAIRYGE